MSQFLVHLFVLLRGTESVNAHSFFLLDFELDFVSDEGLELVEPVSLLLVLSLFELSLLLDSDLLEPSGLSAA
jgi:hypothetical protein